MIHSLLESCFQVVPRCFEIEMGEEDGYERLRIWPTFLHLRFCLVNCSDLHDGGLVWFYFIFLFFFFYPTCNWEKDREAQKEESCDHIWILAVIPGAYYRSLFK